MRTLSRLLLFALLAVSMIGGILLSQPPAQATADVVTYSWSYPSLGSHERVCKAVTTHLFTPDRAPVDQSVQPVKVRSQIVDPHYCQSAL
ncbi:hypothetical protein PN441_17440 [Spirulina major CS-329]|jgi:hypothetical protein|uniref:hypothetical protein n=1 Tax=Spirulina TaxID=1154 RepID=UPI0009327116|nr:MULTISPECIES: hypothetical protein [Spirulina]MDB9493613.1 hypothetical protein [Spirulina subsalsa CS-330]MDB9504865.1 hypothetical protein [Spirulina major CS-329]